MTDILEFRKQLAAKHPQLEQVMREPELSLQEQATTQKFSQQLFLARAKRREGVVLNSRSVKALCSRLHIPSKG